MAHGIGNAADLTWNISNELTLLIFGELDPDSLFACRVVCRHFDNVIRTNAGHLVSRITSSTPLSTAALCFPRQTYEPLIATGTVVPQWRVPSDPSTSRELYDAFPPWKLPLLTYSYNHRQYSHLPTCLRYLQMLHYRTKKVDDVYGAVQKTRSAAKSPLKLSLRLLWSLSDVKGPRAQQSWYKDQPRIFADLIRHIMVEYRKALHRRIRRRHPECLKPEVLGVTHQFTPFLDTHANPVVSELMDRMKEDDTRRRILGALHVALISLTQQRGPLFFLEVHEWNIETMWAVKYELKKGAETYTNTRDSTYLDFGDQRNMPAHDNSDLTKEEWEQMLVWTEGDDERDWDRDDVRHIINTLCLEECDPANSSEASTGGSEADVATAVLGSLVAQVV